MEYIWQCSVADGDRYIYMCVYIYMYAKRIEKKIIIIIYIYMLEMIYIFMNAFMCKSQRCLQTVKFLLLLQDTRSRKEKRRSWNRKEIRTENIEAREKRNRETSMNSKICERKMPWTVYNKVCVREQRMLFPVDRPCPVLGLREMRSALGSACTDTLSDNIWMDAKLQSAPAQSLIRFTSSSRNLHGRLAGQWSCSRGCGPSG